MLTSMPECGETPIKVDFGYMTGIQTSKLEENDVRTI